MSVPRGSFVVVALLTLSACLRDTEIPDPPPPGPVITDFFPKRAFIGDEVHFAGSGWDCTGGDDAGNPATGFIVEFPDGYSARVQGCDDGGAMVATVPWGVESYGSILAFAPSGNSNIMDGFYSLGSGHPSIGGFVDEVGIRSEVSGVGVSNGRVIVPFRALKTLVPSTGDPIRVGRPILSFAQSADGTTLYTGHAAHATQALRAIDTVTGATQLVGGSPQVSLQWLAPAPAGSTGAPVFAAGLGADGTWSALAFTPQSGRLVAAAVAAPMLSVVGFAALDETRVVFAGRKLSGGREGSGLAFATPSTPGAGIGWLEAPAGTVVTGAMTLVGVGAGARLVVALDTGELATVNPATLTWELRFASGSTQAPVALAPSSAGDGGVRVLAAFEAEQALRSVELGVGAEWVVVVRGHPSGLALDGARAVVPDRGSNRVDLVDLTTQRSAGSLGFELGLGSAPDCLAGPISPFDYYAEGPEGTFAVMALARRTKQIILLDPSALVLLPPWDLSLDAGTPLGLAAGPAPEHEVWVLHEKMLGVAGPTGEALVIKDLPAPPKALVFTEGRVIVGLPQALVTYSNASGAWVQESTKSLGPNALLRHLQAHDDVVEVAWTEGARVRAAKWPAAVLATGGAPSSGYESATSGPRGFAGALDVEGAMTLFFTSAEVPVEGGSPRTGPAALPLSSTYTAGTLVPSPVTQPMTMFPSPDRRFFLWADTQAADNVIHLTNARSVDNLYEYYSYRLPGPFATPTFDPSGDWLYIPMPTRDSFYVVQ